ncbi:putative endothiapepsin precursor, partial [Talaromyces proteolyticus]
LNSIINIGTPGQSMDVRFDSAFNGVTVQSTMEDPLPVTGVVFNQTESTSFESSADNYYYEFGDGSWVEVVFASDTIDIGGVDFTDIPFGRLNYHQEIGRSLPFGGGSSVIGLNLNPNQGLAKKPSFMYAIKSQLKEWTCMFDSSREWRNGTVKFGEVSPADYSGDIAWAGRVIDDDETWAINLTAISAGSRTDPPIKSWSVAISTADISLQWPQKLLDWYFSGINGATWSSYDNTYRYPCNSVLPDFVFGLGNGTFTIPGVYMPYQRDSSGETCVTLLTGDNSTDPKHLYSFGTWWSQLGVLILDYQNAQVGFANKKNPLPIFSLPLLEEIDFV